MRMLAIVLGFWGQQALAAPAMPATQASDHPLAGVIVRAADGATLDAAALALALRAADVVLLGEVHDNAEHHAAQAWLVGEIGASGLAFEMIPRSAEGLVSRLRAEGADRAALGAALNWGESGWPDWSLYAPILEAAPQAVVTGAEVAPAALAAAMRDGAAAAAVSAIGAAAARYGLDAPLPAPTMAAATREQIDAHCGAIPEDVAARMTAAQRLRDAALADAALRARALGGEGVVAVIAGAGHARTDRGAPAYLRAAAPDVRVISVLLAETGEERKDWRGHVAAGADEAAVFDYVWFTAPAQREDPCAAFLSGRAAP